MGVSGGYGRGEVVIAAIPYAAGESGLAGKLRPAILVAPLTYGDLLVCQITSRSPGDEFDIALADTDLAQGSLRRPSTIRASRLFVIRGDSVVSSVGRLNGAKFGEVINAIVRLVQGT